jgi:DNA-binding NtrC family response regulator
MDALGLVGCSKSHKEVLDKLTRVAPTNAEVLLIGPSGVGKELYANHVHIHSHRSAKRFVPVNCGSLSGDLLENTLFGHVGGAFTGARALSEGLVSEAEGGTLFLDEVDSLSIPCQTKLLRFLQDQKYRLMGEGRLRQADVRIIAATNAELERAVSEGHFRKDLFFRLRVFPVEISALCRRPEDIPELITVFRARSAAEYELPPVELSPAIVECMQRYEWPGNIRELENCVAYLTCLQLGRPIEPHDLPFLSQLGDTTAEYVEQPAFHDDGLQASKNRLVAEFERHYIERALRTTNGNISAAARMSGKNRRALFELMRKHEIRPDEFRTARRYSSK